MGVGRMQRADPAGRKFCSLSAAAARAPAVRQPACIEAQLVFLHDSKNFAEVLHVIRSVLAFDTMSSMYASIVSPSCLANIFVTMQLVG